MMKATTAFLLIYLANVLLGGVFESGGGMASTRLTADITATATTITVFNTDGFLASDYIVIGNEKIRYTGKTATTFEIPATNGRGYDNTEAMAHDAGSRVYNEGSNIINGIMGFNIASTGATVGVVDIPMLGFKFVTITMPKLMLWNFPHLMINPLLEYIRYVGILITIGYVIYIVLMISSSLGGLLQSIFLR